MAIFVHAFPPRTHLKCVQRLVTSITILIRIAKQCVVRYIDTKIGEGRLASLEALHGESEHRGDTDRMF